jgi:hypothetical protein
MMKSKILLVKLAINSSVIKNTDNKITRIFRGLYIANKTSSLMFIYYYYFLLKPWVLVARAKLARLISGVTVCATLLLNNNHTING